MSMLKAATMNGIKSIFLPNVATRSTAPISILNLTRRRFSSIPSSSSSFHSTARFCEQDSTSTEPKKGTPIGQIQRRLQITFTCTATIPTTSGTSAASSPEQGPSSETTTTCSHRSTHQFSRHAYEKGIVLIECPGCKNRHLIADNLEWFSSTPSHSHPQGLPFNSDTPEQKRSRTIEDLMKEKGEKVQWLKGGEQGDTWTVEG